MILDASAVLAIIFGESDAVQFAQAIVAADQSRMLAVSWFEASMAVDSRGDDAAKQKFGDFVALFGLTLAPFTAAHAEVARLAWQRYGRASRHPAQLNFGDCMTYAYAVSEQDALLFKGNDFPHTDVLPALIASP